jgi:hypothetical protein
LLIILAYKILTPAKKKNAKLTIAHKESISEEGIDNELYAPNLRVIRVKEKEEVF